MATITDLTFESGTVGSALTANADSGAVFAYGTGGSGVYDNTHVKDGSKSAKLNPGSGASAIISVVSGLSTTTLASQAWFWYDATVAADDVAIGVYDTAGTKIATFLRNANQFWRMYDQAGNTGATSPWTGTVASPISQWLQLKTFVKIGTTATNGSAKVGVYKADGTLLSPLFDSAADGKTVQLGTANIGSWRILSTGKTDTFWVDSGRWSSDATDLLPDYGAASAALTVTLAMSPSGSPSTAAVNVARTATATLTGGSSSSVSLSLDWGDGGTADTASVTSPGTKTFTRTPTVAGTVANNYVKTATLTYSQPN